MGRRHEICGDQRVRHKGATMALNQVGCKGPQLITPADLRLKDALRCARLRSGSALPTPRAAQGRVSDQPCAIARSEEHTSELQSLMRISYAVFCLKKKTENKNTTTETKLNTRYRRTERTPQTTKNKKEH